MPRWLPVLVGGCLGIAFWDRVPAGIGWGALALLVVIVGTRRWWPMGWPRWGIAMCLVGVAALWTRAHMPRMLPGDIAERAPMRWVVVRATVMSDPIPTTTGWRSELRVTGVEAPGRSPATGRVTAGWGREVELAYGDRVVVEAALHRPPPAANPGESAFDEVMARKGIFANARILRVRERQKGPVDALGVAIAARHACLDELARRMPKDRAALLGSLILGSGASPVADETSEAFRAIGLAHILAVSGAQVHLLLIVVRSLLSRLGLPRPAIVVLSALVVVTYVTISGASASVVRAGVMAGLTLLIWLGQRRVSGPAPLALAAGLMLAFNPLWWWDLGFHFSTLATFALLHTAGMLGERWKGLPWGLGRALGDPVAAALWVMPLELTMFGQLSAWSLVANLVSAWFVEFLTLAGAILLPLAGLAHLLSWLDPVVNLGLWGAGWGVEALDWLVKALGTLPGATHYLALLPGVAAAGLYALLVTGLWALQRERDLVVLGCAMAAVGLVMGCAWPRMRQLEIVVLSVGQGDAIVLHTPSQHWYLIDAGPAWEGGDAGERVIVPYLHHQGVNHLDGVVLTHAHADHVGGMLSVLTRIPVGAVWESGLSSADPAVHRLFAAMLERQVPWQRISDGLTVELEPGVEVTVLNPPATLRQNTHSDPNNNSVALQIRYRGFRALLAADLEADAERSVTQKWGDRLRSDVLKVSHHGSRYGSNPEFLAAISPRASLISVGEGNHFHHPWPAVVDRLAAYGPVFRTDRDGALVVHSDGVHWEIGGYLGHRRFEGQDVL